MRWCSSLSEINSDDVARTEAKGSLLQEEEGGGRREKTKREVLHLRPNDPPSTTDSRWIQLSRCHSA